MQPVSDSAARCHRFSLTETFTVVSQDGTASNTVTVTINGTNDTAKVSARCR